MDVSAAVSVVVPYYRAQADLDRLTAALAAQRGLTGGLQLVVADDGISFTARFSGRVASVYLPLASISAVFCKETGIGMALPPELVGPETDPTPPPATPDPAEEKAARRGHLRVVK